MTLCPSEEGGRFRISLGNQAVWDRKSEGRFPEMKELKQRIRDQIAPGRDLGHSDASTKKDNDVG